jgi:hypothetical protein
MSLTIGFWDGLSAKSRTGGFFLRGYAKSPVKKFCGIFWKESGRHKQKSIEM